MTVASLGSGVPLSLTLTSSGVSQGTLQRVKAAAQNGGLGLDRNTVIQAEVKSVNQFGTNSVTARVDRAITETNTATASSDGQSIRQSGGTFGGTFSVSDINAAISPTAHYTAQQLANALTSKATSSYQSAQSLTSAPSSQAFKLIK